MNLQNNRILCHNTYLKNAYPIILYYINDFLNLLFSKFLLLQTYQQHHEDVNFFAFDYVLQKN